MNTGNTAQRLDRLARYAWTVLAFNVAVVVWGASVRASGSGAGCGRHWPLCNGSVFLHAPGLATLIEFTHRVSSGLAAISVFALAVWVWRSRGPGHIARRTAVAAAILMVSEALLGASLVLFGWVGDNASWGRVIMLGLHLVNTFLLLAALALTAWRTSGGAGNRWRGQETDGAIAFTLLGATLVVALTGAITSLGDTLFPSTSLAQGIRNDFLPTAHFLVRLRVVHPALAVVTAIIVFAGAGALARRRPSHATASLARLARILVVAQVIGGALNVALLAPVWLQLTHLAMADGTWIVLVLLSAAALTLERPNRAVRPLSGT